MAAGSAAGIKAIKWLQKDGGIGLKDPTFVNLDKIDRRNKKQKLCQTLKNQIEDI